MKKNTQKNPTIYLIKRFSWALYILTILFVGCGEQNTSSRNVAESNKKMIYIEGGNFLMGSVEGMPHERPVHEVLVNSFWMDTHEVTVEEFAKFVEETDYKTEAEKFGWSGVFDLETKEWTRGDLANWQNPDGDGKKPQPNEPVTQISWNDANEYAKWAGKRLPTEAEWEYAARGGLTEKTYAWGNDLRPNGKPVANWWQGSFPENNTVEDGFLKRAQVGSFAPNGYGLYDMSGNVWEWNGGLVCTEFLF